MLHLGPIFLLRGSPWRGGASKGPRSLERYDDPSWRGASQYRYPKMGTSRNCMSVYLLPNRAISLAHGWALTRSVSHSSRISLILHRPASCHHNFTHHLEVATWSREGEASALLGNFQLYWLARRQSQRSRGFVAQTAAARNHIYQLHLKTRVDVCWLRIWVDAWLHSIRILRFTIVYFSCLPATISSYNSLWWVFGMDDAQGKSLLNLVSIPGLFWIGCCSSSFALTFSST